MRSHERTPLMQENEDTFELKTNKESYREKLEDVQNKIAKEKKKSCITSVCRPSTIFGVFGSLVSCGVSSAACLFTTARVGKVVLCDTSTTIVGCDRLTTATVAGVSGGSAVSGAMMLMGIGLTLFGIKKIRECEERRQSEKIEKLQAELPPVPPHGVAMLRN